VVLYFSLLPVFFNVYVMIPPGARKALTIERK
jgi:hypothetical protein